MSSDLKKIIRIKELIYLCECKADKINKNERDIFYSYIINEIREVIENG